MPRLAWWPLVGLCTLVAIAGALMPGVSSTRRVLAAATFAVSPTSGPVGTTVTVSGSGLSSTARMQVYFECVNSMGGGINIFMGSAPATQGSAQLTFSVSVTDLRNQNGPPPCPFRVAVVDGSGGPPFHQPFTITGSAPTSTPTPTRTPTPGEAQPLECTSPSFLFPAELPRGGSAVLQAGGFLPSATVTISLTGPQGYFISPPAEQATNLCRIAPLVEIPEAAPPGTYVVSVRGARFGGGVQAWDGSVLVLATNATSTPTATNTPTPTATATLVPQALGPVEPALTPAPTPGVMPPGATAGQFGLAPDGPQPIQADFARRLRECRANAFPLIFGDEHVEGDETEACLAYARGLEPGGLDEATGAFAEQLRESGYDEGAATLAATAFGRCVVGVLFASPELEGEVTLEVAVDLCTDEVINDLGTSGPPPRGDGAVVRGAAPDGRLDPVALSQLVPWVSSPPSWPTRSLGHGPALDLPFGPALRFHQLASN